METPSAVWLAARQAGWQPVRKTVLIPGAPCAPLSLHPSQKPLPEGRQHGRWRVIETEFVGGCLEPELVHPSQDQCPWGETSLLGGGGPGEGARLRPGHAGHPERLGTEL